MKKYIFMATFLSVIAISASAHAGDNFISGNITQFTSIKNGMLLMIDNGLPTNCQGSPFGWMEISENNKTILAMALTAVTLGQKNVTVYTEGVTGSDGFCVINQIQPNGF